MPLWALGIVNGDRPSSNPITIAALARWFTASRSTWDINESGQNKLPTPLILGLVSLDEIANFIKDKIHI